MDQSIISRITAKIGVALLALALVDLIYINYWVVKSQRSISRENSVDTSSTERTVDQEGLSGIPSPDTSALQSPSSVPVSSPAVETRMVETKTIVEKESQTIVQTAQKEIFIPLGSGSTKSNSYVDLGGMQVSIDTSKYSAIDTVNFEGSIRVEGGNGKMYARLYQKDVGGMLGSEISTSSATGVLGTSSSFQLPSGNRVYTVQAKTDLVEFPAYVDGARIKITLK